VSRTRPPAPPDVARGTVAVDKVDDFHVLGGDERSDSRSAQAGGQLRMAADRCRADRCRQKCRHEAAAARGNDANEVCTVC